MILFFCLFLATFCKSESVKCDECINARNDVECKFQNRTRYDYL